MSSGTNQSTVQSDAEQRVISVKTEAGDIVKYSGNPAELPGARYETMKAMRRAGAFTLLVEHNASRLRNGTIAVDDVNNIPFVTGLLCQIHKRYGFISNACGSDRVKFGRTESPEWLSAPLHIVLRWAAASGRV